jgi:peptidoglycan/LPS O-acetylase OafA/YrhL
LTASICSAAWQSFSSCLRNLGQRSYEIYLTHMFVVFALFDLFVVAGKPMRAVIPLFIAVIVISALLGDLVARFYSEPLNHAIRSRWASRLDQTPRDTKPQTVRELGCVGVNEQQAK